MIRNRTFWAAIFFFISGCYGGGYSYRPEGPAFNATEDVTNQFQVKWSDEWRRWADTNDLQLIGFFATIKGCETSDSPYPLQHSATIIVDKNRVQIGHSEDTAVFIECKEIPKSIFLYPKYSTKGYDSEEWAKPTEISIH